MTIPKKEQSHEEDRALKKRILDWAGPTFPLEIREQAALLFADYMQRRFNPELEFYTHELSFGTGGARGIIGPGSGRMNKWTVGRLSLSLCHLLKHEASSPSLVIAYDSRRMSGDFARTAAGIAAAMRVKVYLFDEVTPTPILSYAVRKLKALAGMIITASHNPPEYNGCKIYGSDGGQIVAEPQKQLENILNSTHNWADIPFLDPQDKLYKQHVHMIGQEIKKQYIADMGHVFFVSSRENPNKKGLKIVYTPLHGTGGNWLVPLLCQHGFDVQLLPSQAEPDGEFPTVKYPNPEEAEALQLVEQYASKMEADLFLATDPDADRLGAGVRDSHSRYIRLTGNQLGSIMCAYMCENYASSARYKRSRDGRPYICKTIVTTDLQKKIAEAHNVQVCEVLTGFKYISEQIANIEKRQDHYLFGGEESYGYLPVDFVRDKDALASALLLCEILTEVKDLNAYLDMLYLRYGLYLENLRSITLHGLAGQKRIQEAMQNLREQDLASWPLGKRKVCAVLDYQNHSCNKKHTPSMFQDLPASNVLQFLLEPEGKLTIRPSGTEPKIKLYASLRYSKKLSTTKELAGAKKELENELASVSGQFIAQAALAGS